MLDALIDLIHPARSRFQQASAGNHGIKSKRNARLLQRVVHMRTTILILLVDMVKVRQFLGRMCDTFTPHGILILIDCQLRGSGARVNDKYFHKVRSYSFRVPAKQASTRL